MAPKKSKASRGVLRSDSVARRDVPSGRRGKHHDVVGQILEHVSELPAGRALRIARGQLRGVKLANVRAALSRASHKQDVRIGTTTDDDYLYVWTEK